jgi:pimeloyl-ACP methyl ester carboxylesterase
VNQIGFGLSDKPLDREFSAQWGRHGVFATPDIADALQKLLPNATFEWFEDSGHVSQNDEPEHYNQVVSKFFFGV